MKIGRSYKYSGSDRLNIYNSGSWHGRADHSLAFVDSDVTFLVVDGPVYSSFNRDESSEIKDIVSYKILHPNAVGWIFIWSNVDPIIDDYGFYSSKTSNTVEYPSVVFEEVVPPLPLPLCP